MRALWAAFRHQSPLMRGWLVLWTAVFLLALLGTLTAQNLSPSEMLWALAGVLFLYAVGVILPLAARDW